MKSCISSCKNELQGDGRNPARLLEQGIEMQVFCRISAAVLQTAAMALAGLLHFCVLRMQKRAARTQNTRRAAGMQDKICENRTEL